MLRSYLELVPEVLQARLEYAALREDVGDPEHEHAAAQVVVEVHALRHLAPRHRQQHCSAATLTRLKTTHTTSYTICTVINHVMNISGYRYWEAIAH